MAPDTILWIILPLSLLTSLIAAKMTGRIRHAIKVNLGTGALVFMFFAGLTSTCLYVWFAIATGYWQFAALHVGQFLVTHAANAGAPAVAREHVIARERAA